jgi:hypothetical protein
MRHKLCCHMAQDMPRTRMHYLGMERKQAVRAPRHSEGVLDYPTKYLVMLKDGSMEWTNRTCLTATHERAAVFRFEHRFKRTAALPCNPVRDYSS